jgi:hypothetical protein
MSSRDISLKASMPASNVANAISNPTRLPIKKSIFLTRPSKTVKPVILIRMPDNLIKRHPMLIHAQLVIVHKVGIHCFLTIAKPVLCSMAPIKTWLVVIATKKHCSITKLLLTIKLITDAKPVIDFFISGMPYATNICPEPSWGGA